MPPGLEQFWQLLPKEQVKGSQRLTMPISHSFRYHSYVCTAYVPLIFFMVLWFLPLALPRGVITELLARRLHVARP